jgi:ABC-type nitrate/sulfonate/bicarbonate transport system substrate-binding protein
LACLVGYDRFTAGKIEENVMLIGRRSSLGLLAAAVGAATRIAPARAATGITLGLLHTLSPAPFYLAQKRGYFTAAGVDVTFRFFEAAQPIAAAAVSGDIDVGVTALTGGFFSLAGKGALKVIGGALHEQPGFHLTAVLASRKAYQAGLTSLDKLGGHSFGITQFGSSFHYMLGRLAQAEHEIDDPAAAAGYFQHARGDPHRPGRRHHGDRLDGAAGGGQRGRGDHRLGR